MAQAESADGEELDLTVIDTKMTEQRNLVLGNTKGSNVGWPRGRRLADSRELAGQRLNGVP